MEVEYKVICYTDSDRFVGWLCLYYNSFSEKVNCKFLEKNIENSKKNLINNYKKATVILMIL